MTMTPEVRGAPSARPITQAYPEPDRGATTARLLDELHHTDDENEKAALRAEVVVLNMGVARAIAHRYRQRGLAEDDLVQAAYVGLVKAVNGFDPSHERDFLSYAVPTVTGEVKRYFRDFGWAVRPPRRVQELQGQIAKISSELTQKLGRSPTPRELAEVIGCTVEEIMEGIESSHAYATLSLDATDDNDDGPPAMLATLGVEDANIEHVEVRESIKPLLEGLGEREKRILLLRFFKNMTQSQIAEEIGVSQMHVSRLLTRTLAQLRTSLEAD